MAQLCIFVWAERQPYHATWFEPRITPHVPAIVMATMRQRVECWCRLCATHQTALIWEHLADGQQLPTASVMCAVLLTLYPRLSGNGRYYLLTFVGQIKPPRLRVHGREELA